MLGRPTRRRGDDSGTRGAGEVPDGGDNRKRALVLCSLAMPLLLGAYVVALWASTPRSGGTELRIDQFTTLARQGQITDATILDADNRIVGTYDEGRYSVAFGSDTLFSRLLDVLDQAGIPTSVDQQSFKSLLMPITYVLPVFIMIDGMLLIFLIFGKGGEAMLRFGRSAGCRPRIGCVDRTGSVRLDLDPRRLGHRPRTTHIVHGVARRCRSATSG